MVLFSRGNCAGSLQLTLAARPGCSFCYKPWSQGTDAIRLEIAGGEDPFIKGRERETVGRASKGVLVKASTSTIRNKISRKKEKKNSRKKRGKRKLGRESVLVKAEPWGWFRTNFSPMPSELQLG